MANPEIRNIVKEWLEKKEYDGLYLEDVGCGCLLGDLMPCCTPDERCQAGYQINFNNDKCSCGEGCDWHIGPERG